MAFLLQRILLEPQVITGLGPVQLNQLISQARSSRLLAALAAELERNGLLAQLPDTVARHFRSALLIHHKQKRDLIYDSRSVGNTLASISEKLVVLKGAAYMLADLPVGSGRLITDIDIIVPHSRIDAAEQALNAAGWESSRLSAYNERYYRRWGHEIPPLSNRKRDTTLDVHHNILPPTAGPNVDASLLYDRLLEVKPGIFTLCWQDMVIHSATHLFHEGEFHHGLRDLWDLHVMLGDFPGRDPGFWEELLDRARELDLLDSLFHALRYTHKVFATPIPDQVLEQSRTWSSMLRRPLMDFLFLRAFRPGHPESELPLTGIALNLLYVRSHYLRMPLYLLLPHLLRKAWMKRFDSKDTVPQLEKPESD